MNRLKLVFSVVLLLAFPGSVFAEQEEQRTKRDRFRASQGSDRPTNGQTDRAKRGQSGQFDSAMFVSRLMKQFDADGDQKLDLQELTKLMTNMRDRRQSGGAAGVRNRDAQTGKQADRLKQRNNRPNPAAGDPGGDRPVRPAAE